MASPNDGTRKRKNQNPLDKDPKNPKRLRESTIDKSSLQNVLAVAGKIKKVILRNFFCHDHLVMDMNPNVNYIVGRNGSGKSAILSGITVGLGARASTTQRGESYKSFIKSGKDTATIEITLINEGAKAYEPGIFGNIIKVVRTISQSGSSITIKGQRDNVISKRKSDLDKIISALNIQVENPISILNQNAAKTFLIKPSSSTLYALFMKATQLETIGNNYKEALETSKETQMKMEVTKEQLESDKKEIKELEGSIKAIKNLQTEKDECQALECEYRWARVIAQEATVNSAEQVVDQRQKIIKDLVMKTEKNYIGKSEEIDATIEQLSSNIIKMEKEVLECEKSRENIKREFEIKKEELSAKVKEHKSIKLTIKHTESNIKTLTEEITRLEVVSGRADQEKANTRERLSKLEEDLREIEGMIHTTMLDQTHIDSNRIRLEKEERACRNDVARKEALLDNLNTQLQNLSQQSDNSLMVFGRNIPRLLKRIDEEYKKGRFREKPRGPLGASIKMRDSTWTPTVESYFGGTLHAFCVDNSSDAHLLGKIMKEIYNNNNNNNNERAPEIICSKFINRIHDVSPNATRTERYSNILDLMEISDPVVANCLIDQRSPESVLLIPTNAEAIGLLQNIENVPVNCKRALTKKGDTYFPDPNFRTYGGKVQPNARYLQVSTTEVMHNLKIDIDSAEKDLNDSNQQLRVACKKLSQSNQESRTLMDKIRKLRIMQTKSISKIEELRDKIIDDDVTADDRPHYLNRRAEDEKKLDQDKIQEGKIDQQVKQHQQQLNQIELQLNNCRETINGFDKTINPFKLRIHKLEEEKKQCQIQKQQADKELIEARHSLQQALADGEIEKRTVQTYIVEAENYSTRIQTNRSPDSIKALIKDKKLLIASVERRYGSKEELEHKLEVKKAKCDEVDEALTALIATNIEHLIRVENRRKEYRDMRSEMGEKVEMAFSSVLALRNYKGSLKIDYNMKTLELDVIPQNTIERQKNETMTLSGGERSYATVAFVLSLWECTALPFYFLDEFDVFMDKVNRRMIMEILLDHTRQHPQSQFGFLTPLDASIVRSDSFLTIHRLEPPNRQ